MAKITIEQAVHGIREGRVVFADGRKIMLLNFDQFVLVDRQAQSTRFLLDLLTTADLSDTPPVQKLTAEEARRAIEAEKTVRCKHNDEVRYYKQDLLGLKVSCYHHDGYVNATLSAFYRLLNPTCEFEVVD